MKDVFKDQKNIQSNKNNLKSTKNQSNLIKTSGNSSIMNKIASGKDLKVNVNNIGGTSNVTPLNVTQKQKFSRNSTKSNRSNVSNKSGNTYRAIKSIKNNIADNKNNGKFNVNIVNAKNLNESFNSNLHSNGTITDNSNNIDSKLENIRIKDSVESGIQQVQIIDGSKIEEKENENINLRKSNLKNSNNYENIRKETSSKNNEPSETNGDIEYKKILINALNEALIDNERLKREIEIKNQENLNLKKELLESYEVVEELNNRYEVNFLLFFLVLFKRTL